MVDAISKTQYASNNCVCLKWRYLENKQSYTDRKCYRASKFIVCKMKWAISLNFAERESDDWSVYNLKRR